MFSAEDIIRLRANATERQLLLTRLAILEQQDTTILTKAENMEHIDASVFPCETYRLLTEFLRAPKHILSHEDIRQDVMLLQPDEEGGDGSALRQVIDRARKKLKDHPHLRYEIKNIRGKGYQLVRKKV